MPPHNFHGGGGGGLKGERPLDTQVADWGLVACRGYVDLSPWVAGRSLVGFYVSTLHLQLSSECWQSLCAAWRQKLHMCRSAGWTALLVHSPDCMQCTPSPLVEL